MICIVTTALLAGEAAPAARRPPNILIIVADDMGFSDLGCYGGEIETPNLDKLAADGLRFTQFYNTARCWPTRCAIVTGYYPQQTHMDPPKGRFPEWTRVMPHYLKPLGYRCYHSGKWHVPGAPKPVADGGFDHSYVLHDHDHNFNPKNHWEDDTPLPAVAPDSGYYTSTAFADHAIKYLKEHAEKHADKPFFEYLCFTVPHFPLHAPAEDVAKYRNRYLAGWDAIREARWKRVKELGITNCALPSLEPDLLPRGFKPSVVEKIGAGETARAVPWQELSEGQRKLQAAKMAVHAAMVDRMDREIGRVLDQLRAMNALDNTVVFFLSDNGCSSEMIVRGDGHDPSAPPGSDKSFLCLGPGWSSASNTPFRRHKIWNHEGGIATPLIVHWPAGIAARGELRRDMGHCIDFVPTLLDLAGIQPGDAWNGAKAPPLPGRSLVPAFARDGAVQRDALYFRHDGNRALRMGDWKIVAAREEQALLELYDLSKDRCEMTNLAAKEPDRVRQMEAKWNELDEQFRRDAGPVDAAEPKPKREQGKDRNE
jgi:arylsulfatase